MRSVFTVLLVLFSVGAISAQSEGVKGIELYQEGKFAESVAVLQKVVDAEPTNRVALMYLAGSLSNLGRTDEALTAMQKPGGGPRIDYKYDKELKVTSKPNPSYTSEARRKGVKGKIIAAVEFKGDGKIGFVMITRGLSDGLDENVVEVAKKIKFEPAVRNEKAASVIKMLEYSFNTY